MNTKSNISLPQEPHTDTTGQKLNWLRAAVLGANDGIVSTASIIVGVAGASNSSAFILTAGIAGMVAGALSMGVGEYVSVSTQRDTEKAMLEKERLEILSNPKQELEELTSMYEQKGLAKSTARIVAEELTLRDAYAAHIDVELGIDPNDLTNPWAAALASTLSFICGAIIPVIMIIIPPPSLRIPVTFSGVLLALIVTGTLSAHVGGANKARATARVVLGGFLAMLVTFGIGKLFGVIGL